MGEAEHIEQPLETGWDLTTPPDDTILHLTMRAVAADTLNQAGATGARWIETEFFVASDLGVSGAYANTVVLLRPLTPDVAPGVIEQINTFFATDDAKGFACIYSVWPEPDFSKDGWTLGGHPPVHFLPAGAPIAADPEGILIRPAETVSDLYGIIDCANAAFDGKPSVPSAVVSERSLLEPRRRYWVALCDGQIVGGCSLWLGAQVTYVSLVATDSDFRRRGIGRALTSRANVAQPENPVVLISSDDGRALYDQMGYFRLMRLTFWYRVRE